MTIKNLWSTGLLALSLSMTGCSSESLNVQRQFPFTLTGEAIAATVKPGVDIPFEVTITPERTTTTSVYQLKWRPLSEATGILRLNGTVLKPNALVTLTSLTPVLSFNGEVAGIHSFAVVVTDEARVSQSLTVAISVSAK